MSVYQWIGSSNADLVNEGNWVNTSNPGTVGTPNTNDVGIIQIGQGLYGMIDVAALDIVQASGAPTISITGSSTQVTAASVGIGYPASRRSPMRRLFSRAPMLFPRDDTTVALASPSVLHGGASGGKSAALLTYVAAKRLVDGLPVLGTGSRAAVGIANDGSIQAFAKHWHAAQRAEIVTPTQPQPSPGRNRSPAQPPGNTDSACRGRSSRPGLLRRRRRNPAAGLLLYLSQIGSSGNPGYGGYGSSGKMAHWLLHSCEVIPSMFDESVATGNSQNAFNVWWNIFKGLHQAIGYRTVMFIADATGPAYASLLEQGGDITTSWFNTINSNSDYNQGWTYLSAHLNRQVPYGMPSVMTIPGLQNETAFANSPAKPASSTGLYNYWETGSTDCTSGWGSLFPCGEREPGKERKVFFSEKRRKRPQYPTI